MQTVEFIESYKKVGNDYQWCDNHGELVRCKDCIHNRKQDGWCAVIGGFCGDADWYCASGKRKE